MVKLLSLFVVFSLFWTFGDHQSLAVDYLTCGLSRIYSPEEIDMFNKVNKTKFNNLVPFVKDRAETPDKVLKLISCGCKQGCSDKSCSCVNAGLKCTILCSGCNGRDCDNCEHFVESEGTN